MNKSFCVKNNLSVLHFLLRNTFFYFKQKRNVPNLKIVSCYQKRNTDRKADW